MAVSEDNKVNINPLNCSDGFIVQSGSSREIPQDTINKAANTKNKNFSSKLAPLVPVESTSVFYSSNLATLFYCLFLLIT